LTFYIKISDTVLPGARSRKNLELSLFRKQFGESALVRGRVRARVRARFSKNCAPIQREFSLEKLLYIALLRAGALTPRGSNTLTMSGRARMRTIRAPRPNRTTTQKKNLQKIIELYSNRAHDNEFQCALAVRRMEAHGARALKLRLKLRAPSANNFLLGKV